MKTIFRMTLIAYLLCVALSMSGCKKLYDAFMEGFKSGGNAPKILTSPDGKWEITVTSSWLSSLKLNEQALMQASNIINNKYLVVMQEEKSSFEKGLNVRGYLDLVKKLMIGNLKDAAATNPVNIIVNGKKGMLFEITGQYDKMDIHYLIAIIESKDKFHQVILWTLKTNFDQEKEDLRKIIDSYKEL